MRVTPGMTAANALYNLQQGREKLDRIQEQIASGRIVNRPSDDPIGARQILDLETKIKEGVQYSSNITKGNLWLNVTNTTLNGMFDVLELAKKAAADIASGTTDATLRNNTVNQLTELKTRLIDLANTQLGGQYVFGGFKNDTAPFSTANNDFNGTSDSIEVEIDLNSRIGINVAGDHLLKGTGTYGTPPVDILQAFDDLIADITANNTAGIQQGIRDMVSASNQVIDAQSAVAGRLVRMNAAQSMVERNQNTLKNIIGSLQEVDYVKAATELTQQKTAFEAALASTAKVSNLSLLDYIK